METTIARYVTRTPGVCGGKPCIAGTRIRVQDIYTWSVLQGQSVEQIVADFPQLSRAEVHAALAYYWDDPEQIHEEIRASEALVEGKKRLYPSQLRQRMVEEGLDPDSLPSR